MLCPSPQGLYTKPHSQCPGANKDVLKVLFSGQFVDIVDSPQLEMTGEAS